MKKAVPNGTAFDILFAVIADKIEVLDFKCAIVVTVDFKANITALEIEVIYCYFFTKS